MTEPVDSVLEAALSATETASQPTPPPLDLEALEASRRAVLARLEAESRTAPELEVACPACEAARGWRCKRPDGRETLDFHIERSRLVSSAKLPTATKRLLPAVGEADAVIARIQQMGQQAQAYAESHPWPEEETSDEAQKKLASDPLYGVVPDVFLCARFDRPEGWVRRVAKAGLIEQVKAAAGRPWVVLAGVTGSGKTHLAAAVTRERQKTVRRTELKFLSAMTLAFARNRHPLGEGEAPEVEAAMKATFLVLDDLGGEKDSQWNPIGEIVDVRYGKGLPTWVTTWMTPEELKDRYGAGITRRLLKRSVLIDCGDADWIGQR